MSVVGTLMDVDKLWTVYKYKTIYDKNLIDSFNEVFELNFDEYSLNRFTARNWLLNVYGELISNYNMKSPDALCPWKTSNYIKNATGLTDIQNQLHCTCPAKEACNGFCTFPVKNKLKIPSGILWEEDKNTYQIIPSSHLDKQLFAETDIELNDDLEIYYISGTLQEDFIKLLSTADTNIDSLSSVVFPGIFQRIWWKYSKWNDN